MNRFFCYWLDYLWEICKFIFYRNKEGEKKAVKKISDIQASMTWQSKQQQQQQLSKQQCNTDALVHFK